MAVEKGSGRGFKVGLLILGALGVHLRAGSGAPTNGSTGTGATKAAPGSMYYDYTSGVRWVNVGTKAAPVWSPKDAIAYAITSANLLAMFGAAVNLIAAPPAGYAVVVDQILFTLVRTATQYANGGVVTFVYTGGAVAVHAGSVPAAVVNGAAGTVLTQLGPAVQANGTTVPTATGVDITNATAAFITGTGTAVARIKYNLVKQAA